MKANTFKKAVSYFALASVFTMAGCQKDDAIDNTNANISPAEKQQASQTGQPIEGQYIVTLKSGENTEESIKTMMAGDEITPSNVSTKFDGAIKGFAGKLSKDQIETLKKNPDVKSIEQDRVIALETSTSTVAQPAQTIPWGVAKVGYGDGTGKTVWVIDSGVKIDHPDLNVDVTRSKSFILGVPVNDGYGHGTAVAGIIGAKNNNIGVVGVAANATIVALKVFDDYGRGSTSLAIKAVNHVIANAKPGDVVNMSLGSGVSSTLDAAVVNAAAKGILFAVAAGNSGVDCINTSPARANATGVYTVSSMGQYGALSSFSNYGASVDLAGPGENIVTTNKSGGYGTGSGTSMAAPHIAGLLALRGNSIGRAGYVTGDKDNKPDPIASK
jgi:subtilisin family serine protease